jgi:hypothetical protein
MTAIPRCEARRDNGHLPHSYYYHSNYPHASKISPTTTHRHKTRPTTRVPTLESPEGKEALFSALDNPLREFGKKCFLYIEIALPMLTTFLAKFTQHSLWRRFGVKSRSVPLCPLAKRVVNLPSLVAAMLHCELCRQLKRSSSDLPNGSAPSP